MDVALPGQTPTSTCGSEDSTGTFSLKDLQEKLQSSTPESLVSDGEPATLKKQQVRGAISSNYKIPPISQCELDKGPMRKEQLSKMTLADETKIT